MTKPRNTAGRRQRLKRREDISRAFDTGRRVADRRITLLAVRQAPRRVAAARLCVVITLRHGNAVQRNRIKRLAREAVRLMRSELPAEFDYVLIPRAGVELTVPSIQASVRQLAPRATAGQEPKA